MTTNTIPNVNINAFIADYIDNNNIPYEVSRLAGPIAHIYIKIKNFKLFEKNLNLRYHRNRPVDKERVEKIFNKYKENFEKQGSYLFIGQIIIGLISGSDPKILDGQHRLEALKQISEDNYEFMIVIINYDSEKDRFEGFKEINSNLSIPDMYKFSDEETKEIATKITDRLLKEQIFEKYINNPEKNGKPSVNRIKMIEKFCEVLPDIKECDHEKIVDHCVNKVLSYNKSLNPEKDNEENNGDEDTKFPFYFLKPGLCIACENKNSFLQCSKLIKSDFSKKCGVHDGKTTENCDYKKLRKILFQQIKKTNSYVLMFIEYEWIKASIMYEESIIPKDIKINLIDDYFEKK